METSKGFALGGMETLYYPSQNLVENGMNTYGVNVVGEPMNAEHARDNEQDLCGFLIFSDRDFGPIGVTKRRNWLSALSDNADDLGVSDQNDSNWDDKLDQHQEDRVDQV